MVDEEDDGDEGGLATRRERRQGQALPRMYSFSFVFLLSFLVFLIFLLCGIGTEEIRKPDFEGRAPRSEYAMRESAGLGQGTGKM